MIVPDVECGNAEDDNLLQPMIIIDCGSHGNLRRPRPRNLDFTKLQLPKQLMPELTTLSSLASVVSPGQSRREDHRLQRLNSELLVAIQKHDIKEVEKLLNGGANPNATCRLGLVSACHEAALVGGEALSLLIKFGAEKLRIDRLGRTPLHLAAYAGNIRQVSILLDFPEEMQNKVRTDSMFLDIEEDVRNCCATTRELMDVRCDLGEVDIELPKTWMDNIDHDCQDITGSIPLFQPGWTPLHVASSRAREHCTRLLLAAGADPNIRDMEGRTPLDVVGYAYYYGKNIDKHHLVEVIKLLLKADSTFQMMKVSSVCLNNINTPLHTAVEVGSLEAIQKLLDVRTSVSCLNKSGETPLHVCVRKRLVEHLQLFANYDNMNVNPLLAIVDVKDKDGHSVLQEAVKVGWATGVCITIEAGADVTSKCNDGETPIHTAAARGDLDILKEILSVAKQRDALDYQNEKGETALYKAIIHGNVNCVKHLLSEGANTKIMLPDDLNILHVAANYGHVEVLRVLLDYNEAVTQALINILTKDKRGFSPLHFAVSNNHKDCVELLLSKGADIKSKTTCSPRKLSTPLHMAASENHVDIAKTILKFDKTTVEQVDSMGWFPLHTASNHGSRDVIALLLREGADLSEYTDGPKKLRRTAIDMIVNNLSKPTEFMEDIFDSYISSNGQNLEDRNCEVTVDFRILMPSVCEMEQMRVIEALLRTGNRKGQTRLLVHPLVESFLFLKWKALYPFFYTILCIYGLFTSSLTFYVTSVFFYQDAQIEPPPWLNVWGYLVAFTICLILLQDKYINIFLYALPTDLLEIVAKPSGLWAISRVSTRLIDIDSYAINLVMAECGTLFGLAPTSNRSEVLYMHVKSSRYFLHLETWVKFGSLLSAGILLPMVMGVPLADAVWPRHVATVAIILSWLEMMFLFSRFPNLGYYVLMMGKVAINIIKILLTFLFLLIGFSFSFMIQFRSETPFDGPWAAFVKTIVMMTSEFDYVTLLDKKNSEELSTSLIIVRTFFLVFVILAAIILMNFLAGVAVNDINNLEVLGNIKRLEKQVQFLGTLDTLVYNKVFRTILPRSINQSLEKKRKVNSVMTLWPGRPRWRYLNLLPTRLKDSIFNKAQVQKKQIEDEQGLQSFKKKLNEIHDVLMNIDKKKELYKTARPKCNSKSKNMVCHQTKANAEESKSSITALYKKVDQLSTELRMINMFLVRLESKHDK